MTVFAVLVVVDFAAAQGAAVFATAWLALRVLKRSGILEKALAMSLSCVAWLAATLSAYVLLGGDGGMMDGFAIVLSLCTTCIISSTLYAVGWIAHGVVYRRT